MIESRLSLIGWIRLHSSHICLHSFELFSRLSLICLDWSVLVSHLSSLAFTRPDSSVICLHWSCPSSVILVINWFSDSIWDLLSDKKSWIGLNCIEDQEKRFFSRKNLSQGTKKKQLYSRILTKNKYNKSNFRDVFRTQLNIMKLFSATKLHRRCSTGFYIRFEINHEE